MRCKSPIRYFEVRVVLNEFLFEDAFTVTGSNDLECSIGVDRSYQTIAKAPHGYDAFIISCTDLRHEMSGFFPNFLLDFVGGV